MKKILLVLLAITTLSCSTQKQITVPTKDKSGNLVGIANKESFLQEPFNNWYTPNYNDYKLNETAVAEIGSLLKNVTVKAFMGTWCIDSQDQIPVFYKIMDKADFKYINLELIAVDRNKKTPYNLQKGYNIFRVPTFIFYKNGVEIGRFVEFPRETVEVDILKILNGKPYKHSYEK